jgi:hypothetical protein
MHVARAICYSESLSARDSVFALNQIAERFSSPPEKIAEIFARHIQNNDERGYRLKPWERRYVPAQEI